MTDFPRSDQYHTPKAGKHLLSVFTAAITCLNMLINLDPLKEVVEWTYETASHVRKALQLRAIELFIYCSANAVGA
jgi:hypothetical protein